MLSSSSSSTSSSASSALSSSATMLTTTAVITNSSVGEPVRTLIPVTTSNGGKLFVSGPCILLKTTSGTPTVAQQMQALRPLLKAENNKTNKNNNNTNTTQSQAIVKSDSNMKNNDLTVSKITSISSSGGSNSENEPEALRCKRRIDFSSLGLPRPQPAAMARRNERERNRVKQVNLGFEILRQHVPTGRKNKKLSKVDTLKEAVRYIKYLQQVLQEADSVSDSDLSAAISDTISIVSRTSSSTTDTITSTSMDASTSSSLECSSSTDTSPVQESTTAVAATNTASISAADLLQLSAMAMDVDSNMVLEQANQLAQADLKPHLSLSDVHSQLSLSQKLLSAADHQSQLSLDNQSHLLPENQSQLPLDSQTQLTLMDHPTQFVMQPSPDMPLAPSATPVSAASQPPSFFQYSPSSSPACSPVDLLGLQNMEFHTNNPGSCGGSDGASCPVSPSESSGASEASYEDSLGNMAGETWQDLSADIADWLCSKIDIDDPEVFA